MSDIGNFNVHLFNAYYAWMTEDGGRPHFYVDPATPEIQMPRHAPRQNIVGVDLVKLNLSDAATRGLVVDKTGVYFSTRFGQIVTDVYLPWMSFNLAYNETTGVFIPTTFINRVATEEDKPEAQSAALVRPQEKPKPKLTVVKT